MTVVKGDPKALFLIATTPRCRGRALFPSLDCSILHLIHTLYCWVLSKVVSSTIFKVFGMMWPGIEPSSPRPWVNTLPTWPMILTLKILQTSHQNTLFTQRDSKLFPYVYILWGKDGMTENLFTKIPNEMWMNKEKIIRIFTIKIWQVKHVH